MRFRKHGLKVIGLSLMAALSLMAIAASSAQAVELGHWYTRATPGGAETLLNSTGTLVVEKDVMPTLEVAGLNVKVLCTDVESESATIESTGKGAAALAFKTSCEARSISPDAKLPCTVAESIKASVLALPFLHSDGKVYYLFEPSAGTTFTTLKFGGAECTLPEEVKVTGTAVVEECLHHDFNVFLLRHLLQEASASLFSSGTLKDALKFGAQSARLNGSIWLKLTGAHNDLEWKVLI